MSVSIVHFKTSESKIRFGLASTYTEDQKTADDGSVLGVGGLILDGGVEALVRSSVLGESDTVRSHCCDGKMRIIEERRRRRR